ncbi:MAG: hypothetical protein AB7U38_02630 [Hyphomicrobiales bacterium]
MQPLTEQETPAKAGVQSVPAVWTPAFAGVSRNLFDTGFPGIPLTPSGADLSP